MKIFGIIIGAVAIFLIGRFSGSQNHRETEPAASEHHRGVISKVNDSQTSGRRTVGSRSERISSGSTGSYEEELRRMMEISNWPRRRDILEKYMAELTPDQGPAFAAAILESNQSGVSNQREWQNLFFHWGEVDPEGALAFLENADTSEWKRRAKSDAMFRVYLGWSEIDSPAAYRNAEKTGYLKSDRTILGALVSNWAQQDTTAVTQHIVGESRNDLYGYLGAIAEIVVRKGGTEGLVAWQREVISQNPQLGNLAGNAVAQHMGGMSPEVVAAWLDAETRNQNGAISNNVARTAYRAMDSNYPQKVPQLLAELSRHESANSALRNLVAEDIQRSPDRLKAWLDQREGDTSVATLREVFENTRQAQQGRQND